MEFGKIEIIREKLICRKFANWLIVTSIDAESRGEREKHNRELVYATGQELEPFWRVTNPAYYSALKNSENLKLREKDKEIETGHGDVFCRARRVESNDMQTGSKGPP